MTAHRTDYRTGDRVKIRYRPQQMGTVIGPTSFIQQVLVLWDVAAGQEKDHDVPLPMETDNIVLVFRPSDHFPTCGPACEFPPNDGTRSVPRPIM